MVRATAAASANEQVQGTAVGPDGKPTAAPVLNDLVRESLKGDPFALREFLRAIAPSVRRICRGVMGHDDADLEDAIQESLIDVARALPHFRFESDVSHYVTKIVMRRAITCRQRARARSRHHIALDAGLAAPATRDQPSDARSNLVRNLLDELNEAQATAILLRVMLGHSIEEIASITAVSVNTVKTRLRLGKTQLRKWLERSGEGRRAR